MPMSEANAQKKMKMEMEMYSGNNKYVFFIICVEVLKIFLVFYVLEWFLPGRDEKGSLLLTDKKAAIDLFQN